MAYDMRYQMNCCIACGGPLFPTDEVLRADKVGARSLLYLERQVIHDGSEWGLAPRSEVKLLSKQNELHMIPQTNSAPILESLINGRMHQLWGNRNTPGFPSASLGTINIGERFRDNWYWIRAPNRSGGDEYRAVFWRAPSAIPGFGHLRTCLRDCYRRVGDTPRVVPDISMVVQGCAECNHVMTQEGSMRQLLARNVVSPVPLVPLNSILRYKLSGDPDAGAVTITTAQVKDPNLGNRSGLYASFQACIAYYIHRCLPVSPAAPALPTPLQTEERDMHVLFAYLLLMILCLMFERYHGVDGGTKARVKPAFRYKGLIELYTSYIIYMLLCNDSAYGEDDGVNAVGLQDMSFPVFHKYWFGEFFNILVSFEPDMAHHTEISDIIFTPDWAKGGRRGFAPSNSIKIARPEFVIGFLAARLAEFYNDRVRPYFSRHISGLSPKIPFPMTNVEIRKHNMQAYTRKVILTRQNLDVFFRLCDNTAPDDIDAFMNHVGVRAVTKTWCEMLRAAPNKMDRLLGQFIEAWTVSEYHHILAELNSDPGQPRLPPRVAESVYLLCYALDSVRDPINDSDIEALRTSPKCSDYLAALRLDMAGAFTTDEE